MRPAPTAQEAGTGRLASVLFVITSLCLAITTAVVLLDLSAALRPRSIPAAQAVSPQSEELARRFYTAVDEVLRTGDMASLAMVAAPGIVEHPVRAGTPSGLAGLERALLALRATTPELRLIVDSAATAAGGSEVTVRLRTVGAEGGSFIGLLAPQEMASGGWNAVEVVRIADGMITERWSGAAASALLEPLAEASLPPVNQAGHISMALLRLTFAPSADLEILDDLSARLLLMESGALRVTTVPSELLTVPTAANLPPPVTLAPGEHVVLEPGMSVMLTNAADIPATVLMAVRSGVSAVDDGDRSPSERGAALIPQTDAAGVTVEVLLTSLGSPAAHERIGLGRATLAPGATLTWPAPAGSVFLMVESGHVTVTPAGEEAQRSLVAGESGRFTTGAAWHAPGPEPASLLVVTLIDVDSLVTP